MKRRVEQERIEKFRQDLKHLPHHDAYIAQKMAMSKANFSSYINGRFPITNAFLNRFYTAFDDELNTTQETPLEKSLTERVTALEDKLKEIYQSQQQISQTIQRIEGKLDRFTNS